MPAVSPMIFVAVKAVQPGIASNDGANTIVREVISVASSSISGGETAQVVDQQSNLAVCAVEAGHG